MSWFTQTRTCQITAIILSALSATLLCVPGVIFWVFQMSHDLGGIIMSRRAAMLFAGLAFLAWKIRYIPRSSALDAIFQTFVVIMIGLACVGFFEFLRGAVGIGIFLAIFVELFFVAAFLRLLGKKSER